MKTTTTEPTSGQFVAMWEHNGVLWSQNTKINSRGEREVFIDAYDENEFGDEWIEDPSTYPRDTEITFYQL